MVKRRVEAAAIAGVRHGNALVTGATMCRRQLCRGFTLPGLEVEGKAVAARLRSCPLLGGCSGVYAVLGMDRSQFQVWHL